MSVYKKLQDARIKLQSMSLKKTGLNKFAGYQYFELADFLPSIQTIFKDIGLCGVISYGTEVATLTIVDTDGGEQMQITSPMSSAALKGCHEVQNLGAVETYIRRYLWVTAMEIVEHDAIDSAEPADKMAELLDKYRKAAEGGMDALKEFHSKQAATDTKAALWKKHGEELKQLAQENQ